MKKIIIIFIIIVTIEYGFSKVYNKNDVIYKSQKIVLVAKKYLGKKYKYGGTGQIGFDCSGFVAKVYEEIGINLPRMSRNQIKKGKIITIDRAIPGDLLFFKIRKNRISHVAIYLGDSSFIHSPRTGKIVSIATLNNRYWKKKFYKAATYIR